MTTLTYSVGYVIRNINTVNNKGWAGFSLVREIACESKRLGVDEKEVLRHYVISEIDKDGSKFQEALLTTGEMSIEELRAFLS